MQPAGALGVPEPGDGKAAWVLGQRKPVETPEGNSRTLPTSASPGTAPTAHPVSHCGIVARVSGPQVTGAGWRAGRPNLTVKPEGRAGSEQTRSQKPAIPGGWAQGLMASTSSVDAPPSEVCWLPRRSAVKWEGETALEPVPGRVRSQFRHSLMVKGRARALAPTEPG